MRSRKVSILKGRQGEEGSVRGKWNFEWTTDFSEVVETGSTLRVSEIIVGRL